MQQREGARTTKDFVLTLSLRLPNTQMPNNIPFQLFKQFLILTVCALNSPNIPRDIRVKGHSTDRLRKAFQKLWQKGYPLPGLYQGDQRLSLHDPGADIRFKAGGTATLLDHIKDVVMFIHGEKWLALEVRKSDRLFIFQRMSFGNINGEGLMEKQLCLQLRVLRLADHKAIVQLTRGNLVYHSIISRFNPVARQFLVGFDKIGNQSDRDDSQDTGGESETETLADRVDIFDFLHHPLQLPRDFTGTAV